MSKPTILIVDDDKSLQEFLELFLAKEGYQVAVAGDGEEALSYLSKNQADLVLADIRMPRLDGISFLKALREKAFEIPVIMITAYASLDTAVIAKQEGAFDYVPKPFKLDQLRDLIKRALAKERVSLEATNSETSFMGIIGQSPAMKRVFGLLPRIANAPSNVLITGESGTGKELIARAIHKLSPRRDRPFVVVNCGGIPPNLLESELFGYKAGAFTGASRDKEGLFVKAHKGTIFLDEIGELPLDMQVKLLRVVQEKAVMPLGSTKEVKIDVRIISATNRNLEKEVLEGNFREDLFYRLNVISLELPPLRERKEDIPLLVDYFLKKYAQKMGKKIEGISEFALKALMEYDFPGNVRELENIIERSVALESGPLILPENLILSRKKKGTQDNKGLKIELPEEGLDLEDLLAQIEVSLLKQALSRTGGNKTEAAKLLGLNFRSFRYRLAKYGLS
ncbi:sigma-54-dependent transcriptional regulator [Thermodesulfatator autotrophicus]|uniref:Fis family transcriptional regulator n=1 Tax=Thermodesulfatator autotrophicus TaxID=1795632 RepID=A0A177E8E6_9BACT|nr:sigma-54 dependent transcriptional regulator [Thermodesulfatator autotrophicus]OAG28058.1 Fis family transcriptional regulator [Thermodesulfatator autotrophicus]